MSDALKILIFVVLLVGGVILQSFDEPDRPPVGWVPP
jgi:hypothetical protein